MRSVEPNVKRWIPDNHHLGFTLTKTAFVLMYSQACGVVLQGGALFYSLVNRDPSKIWHKYEGMEWRSCASWLWRKFLIRYARNGEWLWHLSNRHIVSKVITLSDSLIWGVKLSRCDRAAVERQEDRRWSQKASTCTPHHWEALFAVHWGGISHLPFLSFFLHLGRCGWNNASWNYCANQVLLTIRKHSREWNTRIECENSFVVNL